MKQLLLILMLLFAATACNKEATGKNDTHNDAKDTQNAVARAIDIKIGHLCFDGTNYHAEYTISGLIQGDALYGGCWNGIDTLSRVQLKAEDGDGILVATTGESGCGVLVYLEVRKLGGKHIKFKDKVGSCKPCL